MALSPGDKLGPYECIALIGKGGMGEVYKARDTRLGRIVAIKLLPPDKIADPERKRRFIQEAKAASALNHPNIVTIYDIGSEGGADFIVMEYIEGKPLDRVIPRGGMRLSEALNTAIPVADALAKAHANGIIHRDLKPANILVAEDSTVKLLDFGLAKLIEDKQPAAPRESAATVTLGAAPDAPLTEDGAILGTVSYMSPEQAEAKAVDGRSDIFSFGVMLYEMLTGQQAFRGDSPVSTLATILHKEPKPLSEAVPGIPREIERLIERCLRKDPAKRWQGMADVRAMLQDFKDDSDSGRLSSNVIPAAPKARSHKLAWSVVCGVALVSVGTLWMLRARDAAQVQPLQAVQLTSYPGSEQDPSFSPDGTQIAFAWDGEKQDNFDIYVKRVGPGPPLRLTQNPAAEYSPAWSPDGSALAFLRNSQADKADVVLIPPLGGPERVLTQVAIAATNGTGLIAWSRDGKWLVTHDRPQGEVGGLFLISAESGERRRLTTGAGSTGASDNGGAFSPDGRKVAFVRSFGNQRELHVLELDETLRSKSDTNLGRHAGVSGLAWTLDGQQIVTSIGEAGDQSLTLVAVADGKLKSLPGTQGGTQATIAAQGSRMVFTREMRELDIYRVDLDASGTSASASDALITSTRFDRWPVYSPDGSKVAFSSLRSGAWQVWVCDRDGKNPVQVTSFDHSEVRTWAWSPDGRQIGFIWAGEDSTRRAFVIDASGGKPRKIAAMGDDLGQWRWSADGNWIYFQRLNDLWKMPAAGGNPTQLTHHGANWSGVLSRDGKLLFYLREGTLWSVPAEGGEERQVLRPTGGIDSSNMAGNAAGIYSVTNSTQTQPGDLLFYRFADGSISKVTGVDAPSGYGMSLSPDGRHLLYTKFTNTGSDLMLVEGFK